MNPFSSSLQPKSPLFFATEEAQTALSSSSNNASSLNVCPCPVCFLTLFLDSIKCLHATFNVVSDVTVEQPGTRILRTHLYCLESKLHAAPFILQKANTKSNSEERMFSPGRWLETDHTHRYDENFHPAGGDKTSWCLRVPSCVVFYYVHICMFS